MKLIKINSFDDIKIVQICIVAIWVQIPDGFWIHNTGPVTKRNTSKNSGFTVYTIIFNKRFTLSLTKLHLNIICYYLFTKFI